MNDDASAGSGEEAQRAARLRKAEELRARGEHPFGNRVELAERVPVSDVIARFEFARDAGGRYDAARVESSPATPPTLLLGRVVARRGFGKAVFLRLRDGSGELQLFARKDGLGAAFERLELLDLGDHVQVRGRPMVTRTGELTLDLSEFTIVGKALRPLPEKWHGITDVDLRYRRRYLDLLANPEVGCVLRARALAVQAVRAFLDARGFLEVETPTLHLLVGGAAARPFHTHHNALDLELFLRIAPELHLKRLLVGGLERVYELGRCYRNEGISTRHNPEFTMLEYYQAWATHELLMVQTEALLREVDERVAAGLDATGFAETRRRWWAERPFTLAEPFVRVPMAEATAQALERAGLPRDLDLEELAGPRGEALVGRWAQASERAARIDAQNLHRALSKCESAGERTFVAYEYVAEPFLGEDHRSPDGRHSVPVFVTDHPSEVSPLARRRDDAPSLTERFELFVHGRELCNAFSELNDPLDQEQRFLDQVRRKAAGAEETMDHDHDYVRALEHGMPPAAGFGMGIDRLVMALCHQASIRDVIAFPLLRPEGG